LRRGRGSAWQEGGLYPGHEAREAEAGDKARLPMHRRMAKRRAKARLSGFPPSFFLQDIFFVFRVFRPPAQAVSSTEVVPLVPVDPSPGYMKTPPALASGGRRCFKGFSLCFPSVVLSMAGKRRPYTDPLLKRRDLPLSLSPCPHWTCGTLRQRRPRAP